MQISADFQLKYFNTFGIEAVAHQFCTIHSDEELVSLIKIANYPIFILGGGSNVLFTKDPSALIVHNQISGIKIVQKRENEIIVKVGGGVIWHEFVIWCINNNYGGVENLSLIPGTVGAAPIQNIGAYGIEIKDVFDSLEAIDLKTGQKHYFDNESCHFGYRDSIFKNTWKSKLCITSVNFVLTTKNHKLNYQYAALQEQLEFDDITSPTIKDISNAVIKVRQSKLPDPKILGNAGSFFKNPEISESLLDNIKKNYPQIPSYPTKIGFVKIPAAWLIEQRGWKGKRVGETGSHTKQALVLVNYGNAKGNEILKLAQNIIDDVKDHFGITLSPEVNIV